MNMDPKMSLLNQILSIFALQSEEDYIKEKRTFKKQLSRIFSI